MFFFVTAAFDLNIGAVRGHEVFIDVRAHLADARLRRINAAPTSDLPEKSLAPTTWKIELHLQYLKISNPNWINNAAMNRITLITHQPR